MVRLPVAGSGSLPGNGFYAVAPGLQILAAFVGVMAESQAVWIGCLLIIAGLATAAWLQALQRKRRIGDTPTSKIASAAQGYVELQGIGRPFPDNPVRSPISDESARGPRPEWRSV